MKKCGNKKGMPFKLLSIQLVFLLLFVYNRGVIKQQSEDGDGGMRDHAREHTP